MIFQDDIIDFFDRYRSIRTSNTSGQAPDFKLGFERIKAYVIENRQKFEEIARTIAPDFNIFRLLGIQTDELKHSRFIAELLDPEGSHGQNTLFLNTFLALIAEVNQAFYEVCDKSHVGRWGIECEKDIKIGQVDIALWNREIGVFVLIENKIYAYEQPTQLRRYRQWLSKQSEFLIQELVYLTISGSVSFSAEGQPYISFSYRSHIKRWLLGAIESSPDLPIRVKGTILQYLDTILSLY